MTTPAGAIIARARTSPVDPGSALQLYARAAMGSAHSDWQGMTTATRSAWDAYAVTAGYRTGRHAWLAAAVLAYFLNDADAAGITIDVDPPTEPGRLAIGTPSLMTTAPLGAWGVRFEVYNINAETVVFYWQGHGELNAGRRFWAGPWELAYNKARTRAAGASLAPLVYSSEGSVVAFRIRAVSKIPPRRVSMFYRLVEPAYLLIAA